MLDVPPAIAAYWRSQEPSPVTVDEIRALETAGAAELHPLYREYLETFGYRQFDIIEWSEVGATRSDDATVQANVTLNFLSPPKSVLKNFHDFGQPMELYDSVGPRIPRGMLPVGEAMMTMPGLILMKMGAADNGSLWYWDRVDETWGTGDNTVLWFLGSDLNDMLARVRIPAD